jgi:hypothetical protein
MERRRQGRAITRLFAFGSRWPNDGHTSLIATDPETGDLVAFEVDRGYLMLVTSSLDQAGDDGMAFAYRYLLGRYVPKAPPLLRHLGPITEYETVPSRIGWRRRFGLDTFNHQTGALGVSAAETEELLAQAQRALAASGRKLHAWWR